MAILVNVAAQELSTSQENDLFDITFTNTADFTYAAGSIIYYYVLLTDSTAGTHLTREVVFEISKTTKGTITANTPQVFDIVNSTNLVAPVTGSNGKILYTAGTP